MRITPSDWQKFQHYKDRSPPWIKLHKGLLNNPKWHRLQLASRALAPLLWLLASEAQDGIIDEPDEDIAFRLRCAPEDLRAAVNDLISQDFFVSCERVASKSSANRQQVAPQRRGEGETKIEVEKKTPARAAPVRVQIPGWMPPEAWEGYCQHRGPKFGEKAQRLCIAKLDRFRGQGSPPEEVLNQSVMNGWKGIFEWKERNNGNGKSSIHDRRAATLDALTGRSQPHERDITSDSAVVD